MIEQLQKDQWRSRGVEDVRPTWHDAARDAIRIRLTPAAPAGRGGLLIRARLLLKRRRRPGARAGTPTG